MTQKLKKFKFSPDKKIQPVLKGSRLAYNAGAQARYTRELKRLVSRMKKETSRKILELIHDSAAEELREKQRTIATMDASPASQARILMNKLYAKFNFMFSDSAKELAEKMVKESLRSSAKSIERSLSVLSGGLSINATLVPSPLKDVAKAIIADNINLIKSIPQEYLNRVQGSLMRSIASGGNLEQLTKTLSKSGAITDRRVKNMATDQVRKSYNAINKQRLQTLGVGKFEWIHSGGGMEPRQDHIDMDGQIFSFDDLPVIDKNTGETGIPGQAINCRCTMSPVFEFEDE